MSVLLVILVVALLFGVLGIIIKGLLWLLFIGILLAVLSLLAIGYRGGRRRIR